MAQPHPAAVPASSELKPRESVDDNGVRLNSPHVAYGDVRAARLEQGADTLAEPRQVGAGDRAADRERDRARRTGGHRQIDPQPGQKSSRAPGSP